MSRSNRRMTTWLALATCLVTGLGLAAAPAGATTTIGQIPTVPPPGVGSGTTCSTDSSEFDLVQPTVTGGASYVVPPGGERITSWSTFAGPGGANPQLITMKVFRLVAGTTFLAIAHDGPHLLTPNVPRTFQTTIPVQPGDILGVSNGIPPGSPTGSTIQCAFPAPGETGIRFREGDLQDGEVGSFGISVPELRANVSAEVAVRPSNDFTLGKLKKNKSKGTATLTVDVPGPGTLRLTGKGVKTQRSAGGATASKKVTGAGQAKLKIKAKGAKKKRLRSTGRVKVRAKVTYTPTGDLPGVPNTETKKIKLVDK